MSTNTKTIYTALHEAKKQLGKIPKNATNPFFKSKYFDINGLLEVVEPILHENGLFIMQPITEGCVTTIIIHAETGERIESRMKLSNLTDPQKLGSEVTYYRRYTLQSLLALQADDDDGNAASKSIQKKPLKETLNSKHPKWMAIVNRLKQGSVTLDKIKEHYTIESIDELTKLSKVTDTEQDDEPPFL